MGRDTLESLPRHILADPYEHDKANLANNSYWTTTFVGLGPYRITSWIPGSEIQLAAFDQYFRGRPAIDTMIIRFYTEAPQQLANILSGDVDVFLGASI